MIPFAIISDAGWTAIGVMVAAVAGIFASASSVINTYLISQQKAQSKTNQKGIEQANLSIESVQSAVSAVHQQVQVNGTARGETRDPRTHPPRVLIIDDVSDEIVYAKRALRACNCVVFEAHDAAGAAAQLQANVGPDIGCPFDFVLVDLRMPLNGSSEILRMFRDHAPKVPMVILTGAEMGYIPEEVTNVPRFWITKPLDVDKLKNLLDTIKVPYIFTPLTPPTP